MGFVKKYAKKHIFVHLVAENIKTDEFNILGQNRKTKHHTYNLRN